MDRINWSNGILNRPDEEFVHEQISVTVYDEKNELTAFQMGTLKLTSHRLFWHDKNDSMCIIEFKLDSINSAELKQQSVQSFSAASNRKSAKQSFARILIKFNEHASLVQFEFVFGGHNEFFQQLNQQLERKKWSYSGSGFSFQLQHNVGIGGIQKKIQSKLDQQDQKISDSFKDLNILMNQAKEMVNLSNTLIAKIAKNAAVSSTTNETEDDEDMKKLKNYFLNMGLIDNPVTKESSGSKYLKDLANEIYKNFSTIVSEQGGIITLADVYCRLNRARGMAGLISAEDLLNACKELNKMNLVLKYNVYKDLNLHVLEITTSDSSKKLREICDLVEKYECMTAYTLSKQIECSLIVAKKLLLDGEKLGMLCRDDTSHGLRFYINLFAKN